MPKKLTYEDLVARADENGYVPKCSEISDKPEQRQLTDSVERDYNNVWGIWERWSEMHGSDIFDEKTKKDFIIFLGKCTRGRTKEQPKPSYIKLRWKQFTAEWARRKEKLPSRVTSSGTHFIYNTLHKHVALNHEVQEKPYVTLAHFKNLLQQLWGHDWYEFPVPIYRVYHSAILKMSMYSSARVGEYVKSNARGQSGQGMYIPQDLTFVVICDRKGQPQIVIRPKRDAKNMTNKEDKHPRHPMQENIGPNPLYLNPVLEPLAICLARGLFCHFQMADEIFALEPPPPGEGYELVLGHPTIDLYGPDSRGLSNEMNNIPRQLDAQSSTPHDSNDKGTPFFEKIEDGVLTGQILNGNWAGSGLAKWSRRTGYEKVVTYHAMRREGLVRANEEGYSMEEKAQFAGHGLNPKIFFESYMSSTSSVQGVSNILKLDREENLAEPFRGLTLRRHPKLWQALPAKLQEDLEDNVECAELNDQITKLTEMIETASSDEQSQELEAQQQALYKQKHRLVARELEIWQRHQQNVEARPE